MPWFVLMRICGSIFDLFHLIYLSGLFFRSGSFLSILGFPFWLNYWWIAFQGSHWFNPVTLGRCLLLPLSLAVRDQSVTFVMILVSKTYNLDPILMILLPFAPFFFECRVTHDRSIRFCFVCLLFLLLCPFCLSSFVHLSSSTFSLFLFVPFSPPLPLSPSLPLSLYVSLSPLLYLSLSHSGTNWLGA